MNLFSCEFPKIDFLKQHESIYWLSICNGIFSLHTHIQSCVNSVKFNVKWWNALRLHSFSTIDSSVKYHNTGFLMASSLWWQLDYYSNNVKILTILTIYVQPCYYLWNNALMLSVWCDVPVRTSSSSRRNVFRQRY